MRKWPLNSIILVAATHRKLEKAIDGISTQVATYMINKWRVKINGKEVYNVRNPLGMGDEKIGARKMVVVCMILESFCNQALKNQKEEGPVLGSSPRTEFHTSPHVFVIQSTYDHVQLLQSSLKPSSWTHYLQIYCIGLVGLELTHVTVEAPKPSPYNNNNNNNNTLEGLCPLLGKSQILMHIYINYMWWAKSKKQLYVLNDYSSYLLSQLISLEMGSQVYFLIPNAKIRKAYVIELRERWYLFHWCSVWKLIKEKHKCWSLGLIQGGYFKNGWTPLFLFLFFLGTLSLSPSLQIFFLLYISNINVSRFYTWRVGITFLEFLSHLEHTSKLYTEILAVPPLFMVTFSLMWLEKWLSCI